MTKKKQKIDDLSEKDLQELLIKSKTSGSGSADDPFIVNEQVKFPEVFQIVNSKIYVNFQNQVIEMIALITSQNIKFVNCSFTLLDLYHSSQINLDSCSISHLNLTGAHNNNFKLCSIDDATNLFSYDNFFEDCSLSALLKEILKSKSMGIFHFSKFMLYISLVFGISSVLTILLAFLGTLHPIFAIIPGSFVWVFLVIYFLLKKSEKNLSHREPNVIIDKDESEKSQP